MPDAVRSFETAGFLTGDEALPDEFAAEVNHVSRCHAPAARLLLSITSGFFMHTPTSICRAILIAVAALLAGHALAQAYPTKPVRIIVGAAPGGNTDLVARAVANQLSASLAQPFVIENRPGASGNIAADLAAKAPPDGYTLFIASSVIAANASLYASLSYDAVRDFAPISELTTDDFGIIVSASSPANNLVEFIAYAKSKPGSVTYATSGAGQAAHYGMEWLKKLGGFEALHVPYNGNAPQITAVVSGTVDVAIVTLPGAVAQAKAGKLKVIATTGRKRSGLLPNVATVMESGFPEYELTTWVALMAPARTPKEIIAKLNEETVKALKNPELVAKFNALDLKVVGSSPEEFAAHLKSEIKRIGDLVRLAGAKAE